MLVSSRCVGLASVPERFGFFIGERSLPAFGHRELPAHGAKGGRAALADRNQLRDRPPMPFDDDLFTILDEVEEPRQRSCGAARQFGQAKA